MKITILSHNLSSNAAMRAHRLALAARQFADVTVLGPVERRGLWPALPREPWIQTVPELRFPEFHRSFVHLVDAADGDVLIAAKPILSSYGVALVAAEKRRGIPVILDMDDLDIAFTPREQWRKNPSMADLHRPASAVYTGLLTKAAPAASAVTVACTSLQKRFGGTLLPHGCVTRQFDPAAIDRDAARREFAFAKPTVLFAGTPRHHKGLKPLAKAIRKLGRAQLAVPCRAEDLADPEWRAFEIIRLPMIPYTRFAQLLAAADVVAIPQLDTETGRHQMPMKVYDCMAMAKPIVASAVSDLPQVLENCARIVPPGDPRALRAEIKGLLKNPATARELGQRARARCLAEFSIERVGQVLESVVKQVLRK
ncbi:MAG: glycosyltransferase [Verrucomicrobia subdivision 3 bacterium]|nr:glycosyltransferase [Limisphaerales bacterium]